MKTPPAFLTLDERARWLYAEGFAPEAKALEQMLDDISELEEEVDACGR